MIALNNMMSRYGLIYSFSLSDEDLQDIGNCLHTSFSNDGSIRARLPTCLGKAYSEELRTLAA